MKTMWPKLKAGEIAEAVSLQHRVNSIYEAIDRPNVGVIEGIKAILQRLELPAGYPKPPKQPLTDPAALAGLLAIYQQSILR